MTPSVQMLGFEHIGAETVIHVHMGDILVSSIDAGIFGIEISIVEVFARSGIFFVDFCMFH